MTDTRIVYLQHVMHSNTPCCLSSFRSDEYATQNGLITNRDGLVKEVLGMRVSKNDDLLSSRWLSAKSIRLTAI